MEGIDAQVANTGAAGLSFVSFFCLLLVNLGAPIIEGIFIASVEVKLKYSTGKIIVGVYGVCAKVYNSYLTSSNKCASIGLDNTGDNRNGSTKFLLAMHAIGVITSFMLFSVGMYARANNPIPKKASWIFALFSSFIILLAIGGQIDNYLKIKEAFDDDSTTTTIGASGLVPVILALICSLISVFAFYMADQAAANNIINGPENPAIINNQPPVAQYQQPINQPPVAQYQQPINQPPVSQYGGQQFPPPNSQYGEYNNFQSPPPQPYPNSQYGNQYNAKQNPYSSPPPPQSPQPYTAYQPYSGTDHEPVMM